MVERGEAARAQQYPPVDDDRVHVARLRVGDEGLVRVGERRDVDVGRAHQNQVRALAGGERTGTIGDAEVGRAIERRELNEAFRRERYLLAEAVQLQAVEYAHALEVVAGVG